jgi:hypothetical protein
MMRVPALFFEVAVLLAASYITRVDGYRSPNLGLNSSNLQLNGIAFGAIPAFKEPSNPNTPAQINAKLPRPISIVSVFTLIYQFFGFIIYPHQSCYSLSKKKDCFQPHCHFFLAFTQMGDYVSLDRNAEGLRKIDWVSFFFSTSFPS